MICSWSEAARPPCSRGQCTPTQRPAARVRCHARRNRWRSASASGTASAGRCAASHAHSSLRNASSSPLWANACTARRLTPNAGNAANRWQLRRAACYDATAGHGLRLHGRRACLCRRGPRLARGKPAARVAPRSLLDARRRRGLARRRARLAADALRGRLGGTFVVTGQKVWTSHADIADWCFLLCRTEPDAAKHAGLSLLLVDMRSPGITVRPLRQMNGEAEFSEVFFDGVEVGEDRLVGAAGAGWQIAMGILAHERGPVWTFTFQRRIRRSLGELIRSARDRGALRDPVVRQRLAQAHIEVELLRLVGYRSLMRLLRTGRPGAESSVEKVLGSETDQRLQ